MKKLLILLTIGFFTVITGCEENIGNNNNNNNNNPNENPGEVVEPTKTEKGYKYQRNPLTTDLINLSESLRKNLRELGLSLESKVTGMSNTDPLSNLIESMNNIE